ncbi:hypothetical protein IU501_03305 [Nocardia otitidiscaviarum]|uniref:Uncharacterized protein n=1 Tax=Nocardia otitidiscaviarum TaxID=1823 RepID=A0A516NGN5_9NOCA|nr:MULTISPECIES: hypothetical protein [Nocardia]MBF6132027.1 hypothetical protein [Nocardia otitidiscaviarum]MBF6241589.1 hypothetical protein [Nocardia otitidiscaviarum]MBF6483157.1 hypothetical protein [Nocardia otitidiscaviarum]MCP9625430.1 hypothetical protein [Nocardia otitidiscaviarum]QDP78068.1 hypothetical protein FOH10_04275 [Nocardia otitidiscaviarum]
MARDRDGVLREARDILSQSEDLERKAGLAVQVHEADLAYHEAAERLSAAYDAALDGGWSPAQLGELGLSRPRHPEPIGKRPTRIARRQ